MRQNTNDAESIETSADTQNEPYVFNDNNYKLEGMICYDYDENGHHYWIEHHTQDVPLEKLPQLLQSFEGWKITITLDDCL